MSILHRIAQKETWEAFCECKLNDGHLSLAESLELKRFIDKESYRPAVDRVLAGGSFSVPVNRRIGLIIWNTPFILYFLVATTQKRKWNAPEHSRGIPPS